MPLIRLAAHIVGMIGLITLIVASAAPSHAQSQLTTGIPDFYSRADASIVIRGLGPSCSAMTSVKYVLPCNPAFTDIKSKKQFAAHLFIGNDTSTIRRIEQLIDGPHSREFVEDLFTKHQVIDMEASGEFSFRTRYFGASFTPYRLTYFSAVRDSSYPVISLHAMKERTVRGMLGGEIEDGVYAGLQVRAVDREFVQNKFTLFDAITDSESVLQTRAQSVVFVEPGFAYEFPFEWKPRLTAFLSNVGAANHDFDEVDRNPVLDIGAGIKPPVGFGEWDLAANYRARKTEPDAWKSLSVATSYSLGMLDAIASAAPENWSAGVLTSFWSARVGIVYSSSRLRTPLGEEENVQTTFTEFSLVF